MKEIDVAKPVENFLENLGYQIRSEVMGCDITAIKGDELIVVECKTTMSLKLIYQAIDRQEFSDSVYIAIPVSQGKRIPNFRYLVKLLKRLELGLITVQHMKTKVKVEAILDPREYRRAKKRKKRASIINEIAERSGNYNTGGSNGKIMTAYKEASLEIAKTLNENGALAAKELIKLGTVDKTYSILYKNFHGWYEKAEGRGKYKLSSAGKEFLSTWAK